MDTSDAFVTLRRYERKEVAAMLNISDAWLKKWVTGRCVPHQRSGTVRGVWFTYDDAVAIGRMLPELMTGRQANSRAEGHAASQPVLDADRAAAPEPMAVTPIGEALELFGGLRSLRSAT
jgi:hypothetical protein